METTVLIAIYGAVLSTIAVGWNIYQWWTSGPKLVGLVETNTRGPRSFWEGEKKDIALRFFNRGNTEATITQITLKQFKNHLEYLRKRSVVEFDMGDDVTGDKLPFKIAPGEQLQLWIHQSETLEEASRNGFLCLCVSHSMSNKPVYTPVRPIEPNPQQART